MIVTVRNVTNTIAAINFRWRLLSTVPLSAVIPILRRGFLTACSSSARALFPMRRTQNAQTTKRKAHPTSKFSEPIRGPLLVR